MQRLPLGTVALELGRGDRRCGAPGIAAELCEPTLHGLDGS
jgi:hypothetical protein